MACFVVRNLRSSGTQIDGDGSPKPDHAGASCWITLRDRAFSSTLQDYLWARLSGRSLTGPSKTLPRAPECLNGTVARLPLSFPRAVSITQPRKKAEANR